MKRGLYLLAFITFIAVIGTASAAFSFGSYAHQINFSELAQSQAVNFFLVFLLVFAVVLLVLKDVFRQSYGAAVIISLVVGIMGSLGLLYYYGPIIPKIAPWIIIIGIVVIGLIFWHLTKQSANKKGILWILAALSLLWFLLARKTFCARLPGDTCFVIDMIAIAILIIAFFNILFKLFSGWRNAPPSGGGGERPILRIGVNGTGRTNPGPGDYRMRLNSRKRVVVSQGYLDHWTLDGTNMGRNSSINVLMNTDHVLIAVFRGAQPGGGGQPPGRRQAVWLRVYVSGRGNTIPRQGTYQNITKNSIMRLRAIGPNFDHWLIDGTTLRSANQAIRMDRNHNAVAVFGTAPQARQQQRPVQAPAWGGRPAKNWQALYAQYFHEIGAITSKYHGRVPSSRNAAERADYVRWNNNRRRMIAIENEARKRGITLPR